MSSELDRALWDRISSIFDRALDVTAGERASLLDGLCGSDRTIRAEVEGMLEAHDRAEGLLVERRLITVDAERATLDGTLAPGTRVGPYRIVSPLGAGGMGDVYRGERADGAYRQTVALKVLRPGYRTAELVRRFRVEREALARLTHPGIAMLLDGGALDDGRPYIVLEFVDGVPITAYCDAHELSLRDRLALFERVARTVQFAHGRLVVHRDIKPSNILVQADGTPRLLDFGIAKLLDRTAGESLALETTPDVRLFTPEYAAPEQLRGEPPGTGTDVYALGVMLFELLTGTRPFSAVGRSAGELEHAILETPAPSPSSRARARGVPRRLSEDLDRIVLMALRKEPERRYLSAAELAGDVERYLAGRPVYARPDTMRYRVTRFVARNRAFVAGGMALALLLIGFAATATIQARRIAQQRDRAERERASAEDVLGILTSLFEQGDPTKHPGGDTLRVTSLLDNAEEEIERLHDDRVRQAALWRAVGGMRAARGEYDRAIGLLARALDARRAAFGPKDLEAARIHHEMATAMLSYRGETIARPMLDSSLTELRRLLDDDQEDVRAAMSDLLMATNDSTAAHALLARLMELERRSPSRDPIAIANRLDARGSARFGDQHYAEAAALFRASLDILERQLQPEHEYIRSEQRNLAYALLYSGERARAESLFRVNIALEDRIRGPAVTRASAREAFAMALVKAGRADSAERLEREALALFREGVAPSNWRIYSAVRNLAFIAAGRGRVADGLALLDSAIVIAGASPDSSQVTGYLMAQRVPFLLRLHRIPEAQRTITMAEVRLGRSASVTASHRADVDRYAGMVELETGNVFRAVERFRHAVSLVEAATNPDRPPALHSCLLGVALSRSQAIAEARTLLGAPCARYESEGLRDPLIVAWIADGRARVR